MRSYWVSIIPQQPKHDPDARISCRNCEPDFLREPASKPPGAPRCDVARAASSYEHHSQPHRAQCAVSREGGKPYAGLEGRVPVVFEFYKNIAAGVVR